MLSTDVSSGSSSGLSLTSSQPLVSSRSDRSSSQEDSGVGLSLLSSIMPVPSGSEPPMLLSGSSSSSSERKEEKKGKEKETAVTSWCNRMRGLYDTNRYAIGIPPVVHSYISSFGSNGEGLRENTTVQVGVPMEKRTVVRVNGQHPRAKIVYDVYAFKGLEVRPSAQATDGFFDDQGEEVPMMNMGKMSPLTRDPAKRDRNRMGDMYQIGNTVWYPRSYQITLMSPLSDGSNLIATTTRSAYLKDSHTIEIAQASCRDLVMPAAERADLLKEVNERRAPLIKMSETRRQELMPTQNRCVTIVSNLSVRTKLVGLALIVGAICFIPVGIILNDKK